MYGSAKNHKDCEEEGSVCLVNLLSEIKATRVQSTWRLLRRYAFQIIKQYDATGEAGYKV